MRTDVMGAYVYATVTTDSFDETAQGLASELDVVDSQQQPLLARLADWVSSLGVDALASVSSRSRRAPRPAEHPRRTRRASDDRVRGRPVRRARHDRVDSVGAPARRRHLAAQRDRRATRWGADACRWLRSAAWPPTPTPTFARPPTRPSCVPGRRLPWPAPRR